MNQLITMIVDWVKNNPTTTLLAVAYIGVAFSNSLPEPGDPRPVSQKLYSVFYNMTHLLTNKAIEKRPSLAPPVQIGGTSQTVNVLPPATESHT